MLFGWLFFILSDTAPDFMVLGFLFSSTLLTYTFQRFMKIHYSELLMGPRMTWMVKYLWLVKILLFVALLSTLFFAMYLRLPSIILLAILGAISFFYAFKFNITTRRTNLRDIPGIKIYLIGIVWAFSCAIIPAIEAESLGQTQWIIAAGYFIYIVGITIPFDIRDVDLDNVNKRTIPQLMGERNAIILSNLLIFSSGMIFYSVIIPNPVTEIAIMSGTSLSIILASLTNKQRDELFFSFFLDGLLIIYPLMVILLS